MATHGHADIQLGASGLAINVAVGERNPLRRFGFWAAVLTATACILFDLAAAANAAGFALGKLPLVAALLIAPAFVALVASLDRMAPPPTRVWTTTAIIYAAVYAAIIALNYGLQLTVVSRAPELYPGLTMELVPPSAFWALEIVGYGFMTLASLFVIPVIVRARAGEAAAWLFALSALSSAVAVVVYGATGQPGHPLAVASLVVWGVAFPAAALLIAAIFARLPD